jgi:hypothetical protein
MADLGRVNFNTGRALASMAESYTGVDVARRVIDTDTRVHAGGHVHFVPADLTRNVLPPPMRSSCVKSCNT